MKFFGYLDYVMRNICSKYLEMFEIHVEKARSYDGMYEINFASLLAKRICGSAFAYFDKTF